MLSFSNLQDGAFGLLYEVATLLNQKQVKYIIVGGWSPLLLNSTPIEHPGTKDVDILFDRGYAKESLKEIILTFIENGFILSAKHDFQLFKEIKIQDKIFIYNVDLLHPLETVKPKDIYVEQIDLGIPADKYQGTTFKIKSIVLPSSQSLFNRGLFTNYDLKVKTNDSLLSVYVPVMNETGTLVTKSQSVKIEKRHRDSLDIYLAIKQCRNFERMVEEVLDLKKNNSDTYFTLYGIREAYEKGIIFENLDRFIRVKRGEYDELFRNFFEATELNKKA